VLLCGSSHARGEACCPEEAAVETAAAHGDNLVGAVERSGKHFGRVEDVQRERVRVP
jgi:hypothetical protein